MKPSVLTLALAVLAAPAARAEDTLGERVDAVTQSAREAIESIKAGAREQVAHATERAAGKADEVADETGHRAAEAEQAARDEAKEAAGYGEQLSDRVGALAREQADKVGATMSGWVARGKSAAASTLQSVRSEARDLLLGAAEALDRQNSEARQAARRARWEALKARFQLEGARPSTELSEELRDHEYRVARLTRARALADAEDDERALARSDRLLEAEHGRHRRRVIALRDAQRATDGEDP